MGVLRGINERLITRPGYFDSLLDGLQFVIYPSPGIVFDLAKSRNPDGNPSSLVYSYANDGTPGVNDATLTEIWSHDNTLDIQMPTSGVGVSGAYSFWLWMYVRAVSSVNTDVSTIFGRGNYVNETTNQGWEWVKRPNAFGSDGTPRLAFHNYHNSDAAAYAVTDNALTLAAGQINNYVKVIQFDPGGGDGNSKLYTNAVNRFSGLGDGYAAPSTVGLKIGGKMAGNDIVILGAGVWSRTLTTDEITALYRYPELLLAQSASTANQTVRLFRQATVASVLQRRTLGDLGTRIGSRQMR